MKTLKQLVAIDTFVHEITATTSTKAKQQILSKYRDDETIRSFLYFLLNPYIVSGIGRKKVEKPLPEKSKEANSLLTDFLSLLSWIEVHNTGDYAAVKKVRQFADKYPEYKDLIFDIITKSLRIGCDSKTINSVIPGLIPTFDVQLANKYFDKPEYVEGKEFAITTKIDGGRIIAIKENGSVSFFTRAGQRYEGLVDLEKEMIDRIPDNFVLDGEITILDYKNYDSKDAYKQAMKITRADSEKHGVKMLVFDGMPVEDWKAQYCPLPWSARRTTLETFFTKDTYVYFELLPVLYRGTDTSKITELLDAEIARKQEGVMINICAAKYDFKRTNSLLKVKKMNTLDLQIIGFEEGSGRLAGTLGAFICKYKNSTVKVGSGLTDAERIAIWQNKESYKGKLITINYFEESFSDGIPSLRFPTFVDIRTDKTEADF